MNHLFLTPHEKKHIRDWRYSVNDNSISTKMLNPFWNWLITLIPGEVAPNVITLAGLLCIIHSFYQTLSYGESLPRFTQLMNILMVFAYQTLDALDGKQARKTRNSSPIGELFDHACDNIVGVLLPITVCMSLGITEPTTQWLLMQMIQIKFISTHLDSLRTGVLDIPVCSGPGEILLALQGAFVYSYFGGKVALPIWTNTFLTACLAMSAIHLAYQAKDYNYSTRNGIWFCLLCRTLTAYYLLSGQIELNIFNIVLHGLFWSAINADLILAKMAQREIHPLVIWAFVPLTLIDPLFVLATTMFYHIVVFDTLCREFNLSFFTINQNVYVDGVFDLCHLGHKKLFENALQFGNRLVVGVLSDKDVSEYKRQPVMNLDERCAAVEACRDVAKVIRGSPAKGLTREFLDQNNIHVVAHSVEYDPSSPEFRTDLVDYYKVPREMGITKVLPRTPSMSTSELIKRIIRRNQPESVPQSIQPEHDSKKNN